MKRKKNYWTIDKAYKIALGFKSRTEFYKKESGAYSFLKKKNKLDDACKHMNKGENETLTESNIEVPNINYNNLKEVLDFVNSKIISYKNEIWLKHPIFSYVECSNLGRIRTKTRIIEVKYKNNTIIKRLIKGKIIKQTEHMKGIGYLSPNIRLKSKHLEHKSHRLIIACFYEKSEKFVDHINTIRWDNRIENLQYVSSKENLNNLITKEKLIKNKHGYNVKKYFSNYTLHDDEFFLKFNKNYSISNYGVICNEKNKTYTIGYLNDYGYRMFSNKYIHKLVAEFFLENPLNLKIIDHIDGNKENNNVNNLRYVNRSENARNPNTLKNTKKVQQYDLNNNYIKTFPSLSSVKFEGFDYRLVSAVCLEKRKTHRGYKWKYEK